MSIGFNYEGRSYDKCGTAIVKYPSNLDILQSVANELAHSFNANINPKDIVIKSICYISEPDYKENFI